MKRLHLLDFLRGFAIINVVIYHFLYDYYVIGGRNIYWNTNIFISTWQRTGCSLFVLLAGMAFHLSGGNVRRGAQLMALGILITLITCIEMPEQAIYYGILNFFGFALLLTELLHKALAKIPAAAGMAGAVVLYMLTMDIQSGVAEIFGVTLWQWHEALYNNYLAALGFHDNNFASADYVPLLPHIFLFWLGWYLFLWLRQNDKLKLLEYGDWKIFTVCGKHSLAIYLLHQPILFLGYQLWK